MYAACALEPTKTISWRERAQNGFPVHAVDGCMKTVAKSVYLTRMARTDFVHFVLTFFLLKLKVN